MHNLLSYKVSNLVSEFQTDLKYGLSNKSYQSNLEKFGLNKPLKIEFSSLKILAAQFNFFVLLLIFSGTVSYFLNERTDALIIFVFVILDVLLGFVQEFKAQRTAELLYKYNAYKITVLRDGVENLVDHSDLVPGDIVEVKAGDLIPADLKLFDSNQLVMDESTLSGSSHLVVKNYNATKSFDSILYSGTSVIKGYGKALVVYTGANTRLSHLSEYGNLQITRSSLDEVSLKISNLIFKIVSIAIFISLILNYFFSFQDNFLFLLYLIALAVTVIPKTLPLIITFSLSQGALKLFHNKVLVKRLPVIEKLGGIEVLCTDKTGTLTENKLHLVNSLSLNHFDISKLAYMSVSEIGQRDSFDQAIVESNKFSFPYKIVEELPFDSYTKKSERLVNYAFENHFIVKGSFDSLIPDLILSNSQATKLMDFNKTEVSKGRRVLVFGHLVTKSESIETINFKGISVAGALSFEDPLKFSTIEALKKAENLDLDLRILTGDSKDLTFNIANQLELVESESEVISLKDYSHLNTKDLEELIFRTKVFCNLTPEDKYFIVRVLQQKYKVGYLGDGINDAPSLKVADVGIAVSQSSDIAKESSDIIINKKSLNVLLDGILEGRKIFNNINKYFKITLSANFGNFFAMLSSIFFVPFLPLKPSQILLLNFISDAPLLSISTDRVDKVTLKKPSHANFINLMKIILVMGFISTCFDFVVFFYFKSFGAITLQSAWFLASVLTEVLIIFSLRTSEVFYKGSKPGLWLVWVSILITFFAFLSVQNTKLATFFGFAVLELPNLLIIVSLGALYFLTSEIVKIFILKNSNKIQHLV